ncbi:MAG: antibiotic biosynthesis monooxygenase [Proteobacteria bacterium]|nr:antibiotic biosynthesis monooxygenase [Pseudomonadota bacterium]
MIIVWGRANAKAEHFDDALRLALEHVHRSRNEPGCLHHSVQSDVETPHSLIFYEEWEDMAALQVHFQVPESGRFVAELTALLAGDPEMKIYEATPVQ